MQKEIIFTENAPKPIGPYSQAVKAGNLVFLSGQIAIDPKSGKIVEGFEAQARLVLENVKAVLEAAGSSIDKVIKANIYLVDLGKFGEFNSIYAEYFGESKPARACVEVSRLPKEVEVEMEVVAIC